MMPPIKVRCRYKGESQAPSILRWRLRSQANPSTGEGMLMVEVFMRAVWDLESLDDAERWDAQKYLGQKVYPHLAVVGINSEWVRKMMTTMGIDYAPDAVEANAAKSMCAADPNVMGLIAAAKHIGICPHTVTRLAKRAGVKPVVHQEDKRRTWYRRKDIEMLKQKLGKKKQGADEKEKQYDKGLIDAAGASKMLGVSRWTFNERVRAGSIRPALNRGSTTRRLYAREDIERLARDRGVTGDHVVSSEGAAGILKVGLWAAYRILRNSTHIKPIKGGVPGRRLYAREDIERLARERGKK